VLAEAPWWHFGAWTERARRSIRHRLGVGAPPRTAAALRTLVLGDPLPRAHREALARTGTLHFFAVSGLHLSLIAAMLARCVGPRGRWVLPALVIYAAITGLRTPVSRALIMVAGLVGARAHRRPFRPLPQLLLAATILLALDPGSLGTPGFALSFCAYGGIVLIALPVLDRRRGDPLGPLERGLGARLPWSEHLVAAGWVSAAAFFASAPATAWFFHRITPAGLPGSILIAPAIPVLILCAAALIVIPGCPPVLAIAGAALGVLDFLVTCLDRMPGGSWTVSRPHVLALLASGAGSLWLAWSARRGRMPRHALLVMITGTAVLAIPRSPPPPGAYLIPAGRGSALLVRTADETVLIDAGPKEARVASSLLDRGVRHLDGLVITHAHEDHAGGRDEVRERLHVEREGPTASGARILWPPSNDHRLGTNDLSAVLRFEGTHHRLLITGDLETAGTRALLAARDELDADILVLPHHGARNDALADLIGRSLPDRCWLPARAGFPSEISMLTLTWLGLAAEPTWRTGAALPSLVEWPYRKRK